jgi:hypothetical protein
MNKLTNLAFIAVLLSPWSFGQAPAREPVVAEEASPPLDHEVAFFEVTNGSLMHGLSELSRNAGVPLHLGIEQALRERLADAADRNVRIFSVRLERKTVRDILDALCKFDPRYQWSTDGQTIDVYPVSRARDASDLLNFRIGQIKLAGIPDPGQALTPLSKQFPGEQVGYMGVGGDSSYREGWTVTFEHVSVRQFIDRITEHMGPASAWVWQGGKDARMFTFIKGGFYDSR